MASGQIKGIIIEIGGNTTKLSQALKDVEKQSSNLQKELNQVERLLKFDPKNTELLAQKQKILNDQISTTSEKLNILKEAQKQVQTQFEKGEITEEQYRELNRELIKTEEALKKQEKQLKSTDAEIKKNSSSFNDFSKTADDFGKKSKEAFEKTKVASTVAAGAIIAVSVAMDKIDEGMDNIIIKTGAVGESAKEFKEIYNQIIDEFPAKFSDIGNAIGEVSTRFGLMDEPLKQTSIDFLEFARVTGNDVNQSIRLVSRYMGDAGIETSNYNDVLDNLTKASQVSGIEISNLTENLAKYGAPMRVLGYDTKETIAMFSQWEKEGVNVEIAFSGMKKAISSWSAEGKDAREEFKLTIDEIKNLPDIASATTKAIEIFGQKAGPDLADAIQGGRFEFDAFLQEIEDSAGIVDKTFDELAGEPEEIEISMNRLTNAVGSLSDSLMENLAPTIGFVADIADTLSDAFNNLPDPIKDMISIIIILTGVLAPVLLGISLISGLLASLPANLGIIGTILSKTLTPIITTISTFITGTLIPIITTIIGAIGAVPIAIGAIIATLAFLFVYCEDFRNIVLFVFDEVKKVFQSFDDWLSEIFATDWSEIFGGFGDVVNGLLITIQEIWNAIKKIFGGIIDFINGVFSLNWEKAWEGVSDIFEGIADGLSAIFKAPINLIIGIINGLIGGINEMIRTINNIGFDLPDFLGGGHIGFDIGELEKIQYLAKGGLAYGETKAIVGDNPNAKNDPEVIAPLSKLKEYINPAEKGDIFNININASIEDLEDLAKLIRLIKEYKIKARMGKVGAV